MHPAHVPPGFGYLLHRRHEPGGPDRRTGASGVLVSSDHAGTHIDALCHQAEDLRIHGARQVQPRLQTSAGFTELGIDTVEPILARGVLIDLAPCAPARWVPVAEVRAAAEAHGVEPQAGDVVLVRTGAGALWNRPDEYLRAAGMAGEVSQWLADLGVRAVGADNVAWDWLEGTDPATGTTLPGHVILLVRAGIHILEHLYLEDLARDGVREFTMICLPLKIKGATGSPVRPIALVE